MSWVKFRLNPSLEEEEGGRQGFFFVLLPFFIQRFGKGSFFQYTNNISSTKIAHVFISYLFAFQKLFFVCFHPLIHSHSSIHVYILLKSNFVDTISLLQRRQYIAAATAMKNLLVVTFHVLSANSIKGLRHLLWEVQAHMQGISSIFQELDYK